MAAAGMNGTGDPMANGAGGFDQYATVVLGERAGVVCVGYGRDPYWDGDKYRHREWRELRYAWPAERDRLAGDAAREMAAGVVDIYVCPAVRPAEARARRKDGALPPAVCWADLDGSAADDALLAELDPFVVHSGRPGHRHVYVPLARPVDLGTWRALQVALRDRLGGDDKIADNDLLRLADTLNHKGTPAWPVRVEPWAGTRWEPDELAALLGIDAEAPAPNPPLTVAVPPAAPGSVDPATLPRAVRDALAAPALANGTPVTADRSRAHDRLVHVCREAGLTLGQTLTVCAGYGPSVAKYGDRLAAEVSRSWSKHELTRALLLADPLPNEPQSELGYARRFVAVFGDRVRFVPAWRRWLVWDGRRWATDETGQVARWAKSIARRVTTDAMAIVDKDAHRTAVNLARRGESAAGVAGMLTLAGTEPGIAVTPDALDADPWLLNCENGTLDLRDGQLHPFDPARMLTKITGAAYEPDAAGAEFDKFLSRIQPDEQMRSYLGRLLGHALLGAVREHILPIWHGAGANGKGTLTDAVLTALGEYADAADPDLLTARSFDAHPTGTANLFGLRLAILHESDAGRRLAEGTVKRLTGGDRVKARRMREDFWSFAPSHTFLMLTNHKPIVSGTDEGIWRRLRLVPFDVVIPLAERDDELGERLHGEADAVLSWLVAGFHAWHAGGLADPEPVTRATEAYRSESDMLGRFLDQCCLLGPHFTVRSSELFAAWSQWCTAEGEQAGTQTAFATALQNRGLDSRHTNRGTMWHGVDLAGEEE
jgi:putative DNA primase/helicase